MAEPQENLSPAHEEDSPDIYQPEDAAEAVKRMIPGKIRKSFDVTKGFLWSAYQFVCQASWVFFSILTISYGPLLFENELQRNAQLEESNGKPEKAKFTEGVDDNRSP